MTGLAGSTLISLFIHMCKTIDIGLDVRCILPFISCKVPLLSDIVVIVVHSLFYI